MPLPAPRTLLILAGLTALLAGPAQAQEDPASLAGALSPRVLFVTSGGYWEDSGEPSADAPDQAEGETAPELAEAAPARRGYYRLTAIRGQDNKSQVFLQHVALTPDGPDVALTIGIDEINALGAYVTDMRPEDSTGTATQAGFAAYIYLKTDPSVAEPETWALYIDEFGDLQGCGWDPVKSSMPELDAEAHAAWVRERGECRAHRRRRRTAPDPPRTGADPGARRSPAIARCRS